MSLRFKKQVFILIFLSFLGLNFSPILTPHAKSGALDPVSGPATAAATWTQVFLTQLKEFGLDLAARLVARRLLSKYLNGIVDQVNNSGRTGRQPAFALNWRNFLTEAQYRGEDVFRSVLASTDLCQHTAVNLRTLFRVNNTTTPVKGNVRVNNLDPFRVRARCTMPENWNAANFAANFAANGGWETLARLTEPQNNFYGSLLLSLGELEAQRALDASADHGEITAGQGFTGTRANCTGSGGGACVNNRCVGGILNGQSCLITPECNPAPGGTCVNNRCVGGPLNGGSCLADIECNRSGSAIPAPRCTFLGETLTPPKILGDAATKYIDSNLGWLISSDEISEVLLNFIGGLIDRMVNFRGVAREGDRKDAGSRADISGQDPFIDCTRTCRGKKGRTYTDCIETCGKNTDYIDTPTDFSFNDGTTAPPGPPPPPPPPVPQPCDGAQLCPGQSLIAGQALTARDGSHRFEFRADGSQAVVRVSDGAVLFTFCGTPGDRLEMQAGDGNLVLSAGGTPVCASGTSSSLFADSTLELQNDGALVIYSSTATAIWANGVVLVTAGPAPAPPPPPPEPAPLP